MAPALPRFRFRAVRWYGYGPAPALTGSGHWPALASATEAPPAQQQRDAGEADGAVGGQRALHPPALGHGADQERADGEDAAPDQRVDAHHPPSQRVGGGELHGGVAAHHRDDPEVAGE